MRVFTVWTEHLCSSVEINRKLVWEVRVRTVDPLAWMLVGSIKVVEAFKPEGALVSGEGPLPDPYRILDLTCLACEVLAVTRNN